MPKTIDRQFPDFPQEIIQGVAKDFVDLYMPIREVTPQALWLAFSTYLGNLASPCVSLDAAGSEPRLFSVLVGRSATTRKSTANNLARDLFTQVVYKKLLSGQQTPIPDVLEGLGSVEGLMKRLSNQKSMRSSNDHSANRCCILQLDELNILARKTSQDTTIGVSGLHKLFDGHDYSHALAREDGGYDVKNAYLSFLAASTLDDFRSMWKGAHMDAGFFSRLFLVGAEESESRIAFPKSPDTERLEALGQRIADLVRSSAQQRKCYGMSEEARRKWEEYYSDMRKTLGNAREADRLDTYGLRFMALQNFVRGDAEVTKETVDQVIRLLTYEFGVRRIVSPVIAENLDAEMEQQIIRFMLRKVKATRREIWIGTNAQRKGRAVFDRTMANLEKDGELCRLRDEGKGEWWGYCGDDEQAIVETVVTRADYGYNRANTFNLNSLHAYRWLT